MSAAEAMEEARNQPNDQPDWRPRFSWVRFASRKQPESSGNGRHRTDRSNGHGANGSGAPPRDTEPSDFAAEAEKMEQDKANGTTSSAPPSPSSSTSSSSRTPLSPGLPGTLWNPINFIRYLFFLWISPIVRGGNARTLQADDLPKMPANSTASYLTQRLDEEWQFEKATATGTPLFVRAFMRTFFVRWMLNGILLFMETACQVVQPVFLTRIIRALDELANGTGNEREAYLYGMGLVLATLMRTVILHTTFFNSWRIGMETRAAAIGIIYRETLRMSSQALSSVSTGHVVNLASNDVERFVESSIFLHYLWISPLALAAVVYFLWQEIGVASLAGTGLLVFIVPLNVMLGRLFSRFRHATAMATDTRVRTMNEILTGMRVTKMYAWENPFRSLVGEQRKTELASVRKTAYVRSFNLAFFGTNVVLLTFISLLVYELTGHTVTNVKAFTTVAFFSAARLPIAMNFPMGIQTFSELRVVFRRLQQFVLLQQSSRNFQRDGGEDTEGKKDKKKDKTENGHEMAPLSKSVRRHSLPARTDVAGNVDKVDAIDRAQRSRGHNADPALVPLGGVKMNHVTCSWADHRVAVKDISFELAPGELLAIVGPVGAGKSTIFMALLGELIPDSGAIDLNGTLVYDAQEPWILSHTVQENIVFGKVFDQEWYDKVIDACALRPDLAMFENGDQTQIGERGVTLSGGQKARISLARAAYARADIVLLDDPLSAVDSKVGDHLFERCIAGLLGNSTRILVTHQLHFARKADRIIVLNENGEVEGFGTFQELEANHLDVTKWVGTKASVDEAMGVSGEQLADGNVHVGPNKQIEEEAMQEGTIKKHVYVDYMRATGSVARAVFVITLFVMTQGALIMSDWFLSYWTNLSSNERDEDRNVIIYGSLVGGALVLAGFRTVMFMRACLRASQGLHDNAFSGIMATSLKFFDSQPIGRILNRFSKDMGYIDDLLPMTLLDLLQLGTLILGQLVLVSVVNPYLFALAVPMLIFFVYLRKYFIKAARQVKRIEGVARSPVYSHFSNSLVGIATIRAYPGAAGRFRREFEYYQDEHSRAYFSFVSVSRWLGIRLDCCNFLFITATTFAAIAFRDSLNPGEAGLSLSYVISLTGILQWAVRQSAEVENQLVSVERVLEYNKLESELDFVGCPAVKKEQKMLEAGDAGDVGAGSASAIEEGSGGGFCPAHVDDKGIPPSWPQTGTLVFDHLSLRYDTNARNVLNDISLRIENKEKIGIVGRTGAGKSSLLAALFRLAPTTGTIILDGIPSCSVPLQRLRRAVSVIPQDPILFTATLRENLDPFNEASDEQVERALEAVQLADVVKSLPGGILSMVAERGGNFSVGQRQLICLARAILRPTRVLLMDEATANVDLETDELIQRTIRTRFRDCTVLTIAHRLNTILDSDRVMVLDKGQLREFAPPSELIQAENGIFHSMCVVAGIGPEAIAAARASAKAAAEGADGPQATAAVSAPLSSSSSYAHPTRREDEV